MLACLVAGLMATTPAQPPPDGPTYPEIGGGQSSLWVGVGPAGWVSDRAPLGALGLTELTLGFAHQIGPARLGWRAHLITGSSDERPLRFLYLDLVSVERVWRGGLIEPYFRFALGLGFDLQGAVRDLGSAGYFNGDNGASGGLGVAHGWGIDWRLTDSFYLKSETDVRAYGGAGRSGLVLAARLGAGYTF